MILTNKKIGNVNKMIEITDTHTQFILFGILKKYYPQIIRIKTVYGYPEYYFTEYDMFSYYYNPSNNTYKAILHFYNHHNKLMVGKELAEQLRITGLVNNEFIFYNDMLRYGARSYSIDYVKSGIIVNANEYKKLIELQYIINCIKTYSDKPYDKSRRESYYNKIKKNTIAYIREDCNIFMDDYLAASSKIFNVNNKKLKSFVNGMDFNDFDCLVDLLIQNYETYEYKKLFNTPNKYL